MILLVAAAVISVASCEAEADPGYLGYGHGYLYRPYYASGYAGPLPGASYQSVHRLHKREAEAEAEPGYVYGAYPALYNAYPNWPGVSTPYSQSTCYGCRPTYGKREAEAEPGYGYRAYGAYAYPAVYGYGLAGVAGHPGAATSFVARSPQGIGKRSADAEPGYLAYPYAFAPVSYSTHGYGPSGYTIGQGHPGAASSFQSVTRLH